MASARLSARPRQPVTAGVHPLGLAPQRDGLLVVPPSAGRGLPLLVALHGAGGTGAQMVSLLAAEAARRGVLVVAPDSRGSTWDAVGPRNSAGRTGGGS